VRRLTDEGLLHVVDGEYRATRKGVDLLQSQFRELRTFVERAGRTMAFVETTNALAGEAVRRGEPVGLFMESGALVARQGRTSPSTGIAVHDASKGEVLAVRDLEGIVALRPGRITIARLPAARDGRPRVLSAAAMRRIAGLARTAAVAVLDVSGLFATRQIGVRPRIEFAAIPGAIEAAERGVDVVLLIPDDRAAEILLAIEAANARLEDKIPFESIALG